MNTLLLICVIAAGISLDKLLTHLIRIAELHWKRRQLRRNLPKLEQDLHAEAEIDRTQMIARCTAEGMDPEQVAQALKVRDQVVGQLVRHRIEQARHAAGLRCPQCDEKAS